MMKISIFYATETGNSAILAEDMAEHLTERLANGQDVQVIDLASAKLNQLQKDALLLFVTATCGEGELPRAVRPFYDALISERPDLSGCRFAVFGLGDSCYADTYSAGGYLFEQALLALQAKKLLRRGLHDASGPELPDDAGRAWLDKVIQKAR